MALHGAGWGDVGYTARVALTEGPACMVVGAAVVGPGSPAGPRAHGWRLLHRFTLRGKRRGLGPRGLTATSVVFPLARLG
jgi:hypothetical protein